MHIGGKNCQVIPSLDVQTRVWPAYDPAKAVPSHPAPQHRYEWTQSVNGSTVPLIRSCLPPSHEVSVIRGRGVLEFSRNTSSTESSIPRREQTGFSASLWITNKTSQLPFLSFTPLSKKTGPLRRAETCRNPYYEINDKLCLMENFKCCLLKATAQRKVVTFETLYKWINIKQWKKSECISVLCQSLNC